MPDRRDDSSAPRQLPLELPVEPRFGEEDYLVGASNETAFARVNLWPDWPDPVLLLIGPTGSGKSHLAAIWAARAGAATVAAAAVGGEGVPDLVTGGALVVEDADRPPRHEPSLFHLLNLARERRASLLITAATPPEHWGLATPDLISRLRLAPRVAIEAPDDDLLRLVLVKLFHDRQVTVDPSVVDYLAPRIERSLAAAAEAVASLDREALSRGRRVSRPMAVEWLGRRDPCMPED